jgi:uncharacterized protein with HEPN domain
MRISDSSGVWFQGLRHRLVHDYEGINWSIIVEVVFDEMDDFVNSIEKLI